MKTWFITGCSTGLGKSLARAVLKKGYRAAVTARNYVGNHENDIAKGFAKTVLQVLLDSYRTLLENPHAPMSCGLPA